MAGDHQIDAHEFQLDNLSSRVGTLEEQMQDLLSFQARSETELKTIFKVLEEVKVLLKEYTTEMKSSIAGLSLQLSNRIGQVETDVKTLAEAPGKVAKDRWENMLREGIKYGFILFLGWIIGGGKL